MSEHEQSSSQVMPSENAQHSESVQNDKTESPKLGAFSKFQSHKVHSYIALAVRFYLAYVFISACLHKISMPESFAIDIATYQMLPLVFINPLAIVLPYVELGTGVLLATGTKARSAALMVCGMMVMFMIALSFALSHDLNISCGCFASNASEGSDPISVLTMFRDTGWLLLAVYVVVFDTHPLGVDRLIERWKAKKQKETSDK